MADVVVTRRRAFTQVKVSQDFWDDDPKRARAYAYERMKQTLTEYNCDLSTFMLVLDGDISHQHHPIRLTFWQRWMGWFFKQPEPEAYAVYVFKAWAWEKIDAA